MALPSEKDVFVALRKHFSGENAKMRKQKAAQRFILNHTDIPEVRSMITKYGIKNLTTVATTLLEAGVFEFSSKAKQRFPGLFEVTPNQSARRVLTVPGSSKDAVVPLQLPKQEPKVATVQQKQEIVVAKHIETPKMDGNHCTRVTRSPSQSLQQQSISSDANVQNPVYLPFLYQHRSLLHIQHTLEIACFAFAQRQLGGILQHEGWDCAEAVELNRWPKIFLTHLEELQLTDIRTADTPFTILMDSMTRIRHSAVHREKHKAVSVLQLVVHAELITVLLGDQSYTAIVTKVREQMQKIIEELETKKKWLESKLVATKKDFAARRLDLDVQEAEVCKSIHEEYQSSISLSSIMSVDTPIICRADHESSNTINLEDTSDQPTLTVENTLCNHKSCDDESTPRQPEESDRHIPSSLEIAQEGTSEISTTASQKKNVLVQQQRPLVPTSPSRAYADQSLLTTACLQDKTSIAKHYINSLEESSGSSTPPACEVQMLQVELMPQNALDKQNITEKELGGHADHGKTPKVDYTKYVSESSSRAADSYDTRRRVRPTWWPAFTS